MGEEFRSVWVLWALRPSWVYSQRVSHNCGHLRLNRGKKSQFQDVSFSWLLAGGLISLPHGRLYRAACLQNIAISFFLGRVIQERVTQNPQVSYDLPQKSCTFISTQHGRGHDYQEVRLLKTILEADCHCESPNASLLKWDLQKNPV